MYMVQSLYEDDGLWINTLNHTPMNLHPTFVGAALGFILYKYDKIEIDTTKVSEIYDNREENNVVI